MSSVALVNRSTTSADLLQGLRVVIGAELRPVGAEDGDLVAVPGGGAGPPEDPLDDRVLRRCTRGVLGQAGVTRDVEPLPALARLGGEVRRRLVALASSDRRAASAIVERRLGISTATVRGPWFCPRLAVRLARGLREQAPRDESAQQHREQEQRAAVHARGLLAGLATVRTGPQVRQR